MYTLTGLGVLAIVSTKLHYTLDVSLAVFLSVRVWAFYHTVVDAQNLRDDHNSNSGPFISIIKWLEAEEVITIDDRAYEKFSKRGVIKRVEFFKRGHTFMKNAFEKLSE